MPLNVDLDIVCNTSEASIRANVAAALTRCLPEFAPEPAHPGSVCLVGGGPSLASCLDELRARQRSGQKIWALNGAGNFLMRHGILADALWCVDARPENASFANFLSPNITCFIASQCHPDLFEALYGCNVIVWHEMSCADWLPEGVLLIGGGNSIGTKALAGAWLLGYRNIHLFGYDSSYQELKHHAYDQAWNDQEPCGVAWVGKRKFLAAEWMLLQVEQFQTMSAEYANQGARIVVHGDGLLPAVARKLAAGGGVLTAVYDLAVSPPTYDFLSFLGEAEKARIAAGAAHLDVVFQPGPAGGFRDDNLPPDDIATREGMLWRVCVGACRLLPSVRNVTVLQERRPVEGAVFPDRPVAWYGTKYLRTALQCLTASDSAKAVVGREFPDPYVTITLRQSRYWTDRNSKLDQWTIVADRLARAGWRVIFVPDSDGDHYGSWTPAAYDIDLRLALYEGAAMNLGVVNGPMALCYMSHAPYRVFKPVVESCTSTTLKFLAANGLNHGDQMSGNGLLIWADDDADVILRSIPHLLQKDAA